jgi:putative membrane protein
MLAFLSRWGITAAALALAAQLIDGIRFDGARDGTAEIQDKIVPLLLVALISCAVTAFVKPVLTLLSIPFILVTLGLFLVVLNALLLRLTAWFADVVDLGFHVDGFWPAVGGAIIISVTTWVLDAFLGVDDE